MDYRQLNEDFLKAYQRPRIKDMILDIRKILYEHLESFAENKHYKALEHFLEVIERSETADTVHQMLYGMISNAWYKLFEEVKGAPVDISDYSWEATWLRII